MDKNELELWLNIAGLVCWVFCFWWMRRISVKQNNLLDQLQEQAKRIEKLSRAEHDLIKEVHPQVGQIRESMESIIAVVSENSPSPASKKQRD
jgi:hypothetical protein